MSHAFTPDPSVPSACDSCGMPASNARHANPDALAHAVNALESARVAESLDARATSTQAARAVATVARGARRLVLAKVAAAGARGLTDNELIEHTPEYPPNTLRPRRIELVRDGLLIERQDARGLVQRDNSQVWVASELGRAALGETSAA